MGRAQPCSVVAMEVLVEQEVRTPVRVRLELSGAAVDGPVAVLATQKNTFQPSGDLLGDLEQIHISAGACGALYPKVAPIELIQMEQGFYQQSIDRDPDGSTPVGVPSEHVCIGLARNVLNF